MKNLLSIDVTDKTKQDVEIEMFVCKRISDDLANRKKNCEEKIRSLQKKSSPQFLSIFIFILVIIDLLFFKAIISNENRSTSNIIIFSVCLVLTIALLVFFLINRHKITNSNETNDSVKEYDEIIKQVHEELNIPDDYIKIDTLVTFYKIKNEKVVDKKTFFDAVNFNSSIYIQDNMLYLFDQECLYCIDLSFFKKIVMSNKKAIVPLWNKDEPYNKGEYKQYKVKQNNIGYFIRYEEVILNDGFNDYELLIPNYDINKLNALLNLPIEEYKK